MTRISKVKKGLIIILLFLCADSAQATIGMQELSDSLMNYTGFSRIWSPNVRVRKMRVDGNHIVIHTNATLSGVQWSEEKAKEIEQKISLWVLGHTQGTVQLFTQKTNIRDLITPCAALTTQYSILNTHYSILNTHYPIKTSQKGISPSGQAMDSISIRKDNNGFGNEPHSGLP